MRVRPCDAAGKALLPEQRSVAHVQGIDLEAKKKGESPVKKKKQRYCFLFVLFFVFIVLFFLLFVLFLMYFFVCFLFFRWCSLFPQKRYV